MHVSKATWFSITITLWLIGVKWDLSQPFPMITLDGTLSKNITLSNQLHRAIIMFVMAAFEPCTAYIGSYWKDFLVGDTCMTTCIYCLYQFYFCHFWNANKMIIILKEMPCTMHYSLLFFKKPNMIYMSIYSCIFFYTFIYHSSTKSFTEQFIRK